MATEHTRQLTDDNFKAEVLGVEGLVLVDFWAPWCGPCRAIGPTIDRLAEDWAGRVRVGKMNVDESSLFPGRYGIRTIPTLLLFKDGRVLEQIVGTVPRGTLEDVLRRHSIGDGAARVA